MARSRTKDDAPATRDETRPEPDEALLDGAPTPQPERHEPKVEHATLRHLSFRDWIAIFKRAGKEMLDDNMMMIAQALAYSTFLAIPSVLLVVLGVFTLVAEPSTITKVIDHLGTVMPGEAKTLIGDSVHRLSHQHQATIVMTVVGLVLALWSTTGAMTSYMTALNLAYDRKDRRNFFKKRLIALTMAAIIGAAFVLVAVLLIFGPTIEKYVGSTLGIEGVLKWIWWTAQWPILVAGLLAAFAALLYLGPDVEHPRWKFLTVGSALAVVIWLGVSLAFAFYTANFSSYNKTWGSLAAVIVMLMWLWLTALALLFGAEVNSEAERSRELRQGEPAERELQVPSRA
ncbi:MAG TPA: YihY/virulence factor BrkB family protein [Gaiellaceae bacterium]|jgi:membrane protein|nr:YihY/virulence factor BrkB family protein [Gaiellaceae bacterium]